MSGKTHIRWKFHWKPFYQQFHNKCFCWNKCSIQFIRLGAYTLILNPLKIIIHLELLLWRNLYFVTHGVLLVIHVANLPFCVRPSLGLLISLWVFARVEFNESNLSVFSTTSTKKLNKKETILPFSLSIKWRYTNLVHPRTLNSINVKAHN